MILPFVEPVIGSQVIHPSSWNKFGEKENCRMVSWLYTFYFDLDYDDIFHQIQ